ncbi:hypothetical protein [Halomarina oriensis]|uniref:DUF7967 domain-containing protein n=1 Tax=Halomarina oriensis TaxID=671145 RepID=A0A6B0GK23_9EURY|nr:hypothetical protein [Halomarina oriensis]MWG33749.1 hypothetical protein [Halomarina oriensis]
MAEESDTVRVWLVERGYNNRDLIILKYATPAGERVYRKELSVHAVDTSTVTAAKDVSEDDLSSVDTAETQQRFAEEVKRMQSKHAPDDTV